MNQLNRNYEKHLSEMCLKFPTYHTASPGERDRANYIEAVFRAYGLKTRRESYPVRGWEFRSFSFFDVTANKPVPNTVCQYFSGSVDFEGKLLFLSPEQLDAIDDMDVTGQVIFLAGTLGTFENGNLAEKLEAKGALGIFFAHIKTDIGLPHTKLCRSPYAKTIATCAAGPLGSAYLGAHKDHIYRLVVDAKPYDTVSDNVVGYLEGDDTKVVFGAHYDSAPHTEGAGDNASGTAMLLEMARLMKDKACGHTLEFVAFTAEEYCERPPARGPKGSNAYISMHAKDNIACFIDFDDFCLSPYFGKEQLCVGHAEKLPQINWPGEVNGPALSGDDTPFYVLGIPVIWIVQRKDIRVLHSVHDDLDLVDIDTMTAVTEHYTSIATQILERL